MSSTRNVQITVRPDAVRRNLVEARRLSGSSRLFAVVKADAYGHGAVAIARALTRSDRPVSEQADGFAVVTLGEARELRESGIELPVLLLQGPRDADETAACENLGLWPVIHDLDQLDRFRRARQRRSLQAWLKVDTGMGRLGVSPSDVGAILRRDDGIRWRGVLSHLACADEADSSHAEGQIRCFASLDVPEGLERSLANSAGVIDWPAAQHDWARPGLMLYGLDPRMSRDRSVSLTPAMRVTTSLVSVKSLPAGAGVGYAQSWHCPAAMSIGFARAGYGDGLPRNIDASAQVVVDGARCPIVGRVSMDSIAIDLRNAPQARTNSEVELWGGALSAHALATAAGTIAYEIVTGIRGERIYLED